MSRVNNFDVLKEMGQRSMDIRLAPLSELIGARKVKAGTQVTIGVAGNLVAPLMLEHKFVGGLILADREQFELVRSELEIAQASGATVDSCGQEKEDKQ